jgi:hypothetical protein
MSRKEFSKQTRRDALDRSNGFCEAVGALYGLPENKRCNGNLSKGHEFDHVLAASNGGDASLSNCLCVCLVCHGFKTRNFDTPRAAKTVRQRDKHNGIRGPKRGFRPAPPGYNHWTRRIET